MDFCSKSSLNCLLFDLDDTLYSSKTGIHTALKRNINDFLTEKCGFSKDKATSLGEELFKAYGSTLAGLRALGYDIDADDYHSFVHGRLPYEAIKPDPQLRNLLQSIQLRKLIFTNSDRVHAIKVLERIGIHDCFDQIICFETINPNLWNSTRTDEFPVVLKPSMDAFRTAFDVAQVDPIRTLFLDDNGLNIAAGKAAGLKTVLVGKAVKTKEADYAVETIVNLRQVIPEIWMNQSDSGAQTLKRSRSDMDSMIPTAPVGA